MRESPANRPVSAASGTFARTPLVHLLIYALEKKLDGTIEVEAPDGRKAVMLFVRGEPAKVRSNEPSLYLGRVLVDLGHLSEEELERSLARQAGQPEQSRVLYGEMLLSSGVLDPARLDVALQEQLARSLRAIAGMPPETTYAFFDGFDALHGWGADAPRGVDPLPMLWGILREAGSLAHVDAAFVRIADSALRVIRNPELGRLGLESTPRAAVEATRAHPATAAQLSRASGLSSRDARLLVYLLLVTKQVDVLAPAQAARVEAKGSTRPPPAPPAVGLMPPRGLAGQGQPRPPAVAPVAPVAAAPPPVARPAERRIPTPPPDKSGPRPALSSAPPPPAKPPPPPAGLAPELLARWNDIVDRAGRIDRSDYFSMLDLARDASPKDVQLAFLALAKKWHPDRLPQELAPLREWCSRVFARMNEAHANLIDEEKRTRYMRLLADGSGSPEMQEQVARIVEAAAKFQKAEVCFKRQDYAQAEVLCRKALKADPTQADYHAMHGWLLSLKPENQGPDAVVECIKELDRAIALSDKCERAYFWRGMLHKRLGKVNMALKDFKHTIELNPRNIDAAREVRLYNMRGGAPEETRASLPKTSRADETGKHGILNRFFKKP